MKKIILNIFFIFLAANLIAQTYQMPSSGYLEINTDQGIIYDDGGENQNYSTRINSIVTIFPTTPGAYIILSGNYSLENDHKSRITFYSGDTNSLQYITSISGNSCVAVRSQEGPLTIRFIADTETPESGFAFEFHICSDIPKDIRNFNITDTSAKIDWIETDTSTIWTLEYKKTMFNIGEGNKIKTDTSYVELENLEKCTNYYYYIYSDCDTITNACNIPYVPYYRFKTTNEDADYPNNVNITSSCSEIEVSWDEKDTNTIWEITIYDNHQTEAIITEAPNFKFDSLLSGTYYQIKICPINTTDEECDCYKNGLYTKCCCPAPVNLVITNIQSDIVIVNWNQDTNAQGWIVRYKMQEAPFDSLITAITHTNSITLENLIPFKPYEVYVYSYCDSLTSYCSQNTSFFTSFIDSECISFTNFYDYKFHPTYGTYSNPNQYSGLIDYGYNSSQSRHTVHYDTSERDERTNNQLATIPPGELASVRLGNWQPGAQAESCTYLYKVDTNNTDMFLLKYAIILEDPNHAQYQQPRFTLEILDSNYTLVDNECGYTDFYASSDLNWNSVEGTSIIWKDWTSIGIEISQYHNQKIYIRLTTYDCNEGGHFGYAYFNLKCENKNLNKNYCGDIDSLVFEAPIGFDYRWYNINNTENTLSNEKQIIVPVDNTTYLCQCLYKENHNCNFLLSFEAERRYPLALFDYYLDTCGYIIHFENKSIVSKFDTLADGNEICNSVKWIFHDGTVSYQQNPRFRYEISGIFPIVLIADLNNGTCVDTIFDYIKVNNFEFNKIEFTGDTIICNGSQTEISINEFDKYEWSTEDTINSIIISPSQTTTYYVKAYENGCLRSDSITIYITPYYFNDTINAVICEETYYNNNNFYENNEGFYTKTYKSINGCDSIVNLNLKVGERIENYSIIKEKHRIVEEFPIIVDVSCEHCFYYRWNTGSNDSVLIINNYGNYYITINHICGHIYDSIIIFRPEVNIFTPNAFTPSELNNNSFFPVYEDNNTVFIERFDIYNRWDELLYSSTYKPWDGTFNNNNCPTGVYAWRLLYRTKYTGNQIFEKAGQVSLIR